MPPRDEVEEERDGLTRVQAQITTAVLGGVVAPVTLCQASASSGMASLS